jgi:hypothetical protein
MDSQIGTNIEFRLYTSSSWVELSNTKKEGIASLAIGLIPEARHKIWTISKLKKAQGEARR